MKDMLVKVMLSSILLLPLTIQAQQVNVFSDTIQWKVSSFSDSLLNSSGASIAEFITYGASKVKWIPLTAEAQTVVVFEVERTEGDWNTGSVSYHISRNGKQRHIRIVNQNNSIKLFFSFTDSLNRNRLVEYTISEMAKL